MKRFAIFFLTILMLVLLVACNEGGNTPSVCQHRDADDNALCDKCGESYTDGIDGDHDDTKKCTHQYSSLATCIDRTCIINGCEHVEVATTQHEYTREYICVGCRQTTDCTLEILGQTYSKEILTQARINAGTLTGNFEVVVLGKEETIIRLQNYIISENFDETKLLRGLFVKFDVTMGGDEVLFTTYYNFGLQFSDEQLNDIAFTHPDVDEVWLLEVVEGNKTILFEDSIT